MRIKTVLLLTAILIAPTSAAANTACDPSYVKANGSTIAVMPTGVDDTANLQCAFNLGSTIPGVVLQLSKGTYTTGRIIVDGFVGTLRGMGMDATVIRNTNGPIFVSYNDFQNVPPEAADFAPPYLFVFLGGDYTVTDLAVSIVGAEPATDWSIFGIRELLGFGLHAMGQFTILGSPTGGGYREASAAFYRVKMQGEITDDPIFGSNVPNAIIYQGFVGHELWPIKGSFTVSDSMFEAVASANPVVNLLDSRVTISGNIYRDVPFGAELGDFANTVYEFSHNRFAGYAGVHTLDICNGGESNCGFDSSSLIVKNNVIRGSFGTIFEGTFRNGTKALALGNNVSGVSDLAVYLGPDTNHCTVVGGGPGIVVDLGTDNSIAGMTKGAGAQGLRIRSFLQLLKKP